MDRVPPTSGCVGTGRSLLSTSWAVNYCCVALRNVFQTFRNSAVRAGGEFSKPLFHMRKRNRYFKMGK